MKMSNVKSEEVCGNCVHFYNEHQIMECRKYAPRGGEHDNRIWAPVNVDDWCSEFEKIPSGKKSHVVENRN